MNLTNKISRKVIESNSLSTNIDNCNKVIAIAGNPNVGKSTVFNSLTGLNQHTGNWPGKTVENAQGKYTYNNTTFNLVDIPGTYSLMANSIEEEIARDFICFGGADAVIVVVDATCIERSLNLALQILEITQKVVICVNLIDEAHKKQIEIDLDEISLNLGVPVVGTNARQGKGLDCLMNEVYKIACKGKKTFTVKINYGELIEDSINNIKNKISNLIDTSIDFRWLSLKLLDTDSKLMMTIKLNLGYDILDNQEVVKIVNFEKNRIYEYTKDNEYIRDQIVSRIIHRAEVIYASSVKLHNKQYNRRDRIADKVLTSKITGIPVMIIMLMTIFWLTITGANYPSEVIASFLFWGQERIGDFFVYINAPYWLNSILVLGVYRTLAWVISVMLPPMAIFFPIFTLLEDVGYLPRIAFNIDKYFKNAGAHGKQALTMCMGFGCNACGVIGCRIIDSPRERLIAMITNNFVPCNGRFPTLIAVITMFFVGYISSPFQSFVSAIILTLTIVIGVMATFVVSSILSKTLLKGIPSSFILELPPYRRPQIGKVLVRSLFDRTIFVLARAVVVAAPAGLIIWLMANIYVGDLSILSYCCNSLDPIARFIGLDGVILMAFILGFPANEIVIPIIIMSYMNTGSIISIESLSELHNLLIVNGWTPVTAICVMVFSLFHFPCGTTCLTIKKETNSVKWTVLSAVIPTVIGVILCGIIAQISYIFC